MAKFITSLLKLCCSAMIASCLLLHASSQMLLALFASLLLATVSATVRKLQLSAATSLKDHALAAICNAVEQIFDLVFSSLVRI
jgi:hypothetical protein